MNIMQIFSVKKLIPVILGIVIIYSLFGKNPMGYYHVVQKWPSGELKIITEPGLYWKGPLSDVTKFRASGVVTFEDRIENIRDRKSVV